MGKRHLNNKLEGDARELWKGVMGNDIESLGKLFDLFSHELLTYGYQISKDASKTKDAVQEVFVNLWTYRHGLSEDVQIKYYLFRCVRRELAKYAGIGEEACENLAPEALVSEDVDPEMALIRVEAANRRGTKLRRSLAALSLREREVISLKYYSDLKIREIADMLGLREQTVANTLQNALVKLRKSLQLFLF